MNCHRDKSTPLELGLRCSSIPREWRGLLSVFQRTCCLLGINDSVSIPLGTYPYLVVWGRHLIFLDIFWKFSRWSHLPVRPSGLSFWLAMATCEPDKQPYKCNAFFWFCHAVTDWLSVLYMCTVKCRVCSTHKKSVLRSLTFSVRINYENVC